jgi:hypothetical protein
MTDLKALAAISVPEPAQLLIKPFDVGRHERHQARDRSLGARAQPHRGGQADPPGHAARPDIRAPSASWSTTARNSARSSKVACATPGATPTSTPTRSPSSPARTYPEDEIETLKEEIQGSSRSTRKTSTSASTKSPRKSRRSEVASVPGRRHDKGVSMLGRRSAAICLVALALLAAAAARTSTPGDRLASAAAAFIATLSDDQRPRAVFAFDAAARTDWHYVPRGRPGLKFSELSDGSRRAVHDLLRSALSGQGYLKTTGIMQLEQVLFDSEVAAGRDPAWRDPGNYTIAVYGKPRRQGALGLEARGAPHLPQLHQRRRSGRGHPGVSGRKPRRCPNRPQGGTQRALGGGTDRP